MNGRALARVLLIIVLVAGAVGLGAVVYNAGVSAGLAAHSDVVINPGAYPGVGPVGPYVGYGWGYGHGFGFFGFLGTLFFIFVIFALLRAAFGRGRGWGPGRGWDHSDHQGPRDRWRGDPWASRVREIHDELHRQEPSSKDPQGDQPVG
jgi:hypothetical protein